jgi:hypothetical protein
VDAGHDGAEHKVICQTMTRLMLQASQLWLNRSGLDLDSGQRRYQPVPLLAEEPKRDGSSRTTCRYKYTISTHVLDNSYGLPLLIGNCLAQPNICSADYGCIRSHMRRAKLLT